MKVSTWNKPNSTEVRVYFNNTSCSSKVFAIKSDDRFEIRFAPQMYPSQQDQVLDRIDRELEEMNNGERVLKWDTLINLAK